MRSVPRPIEPEGGAERKKWVETILFQKENCFAPSSEKTRKNRLTPGYESTHRLPISACGLTPFDIPGRVHQRLGRKKRLELLATNH